MRLIYIILCVLGVIVMSCKSTPKLEPKRSSEPIEDLIQIVETLPVKVMIVEPVMRDVPLSLDLVGKLHPSVLIEVRPQIGGILTSVFVSSGTWVNKGDSLFEIDSRLHMIKVKEVEAQLAMDRATHRALKKKLMRYNNLAQKDILSQNDWDDLEAQVERAEASIELHQERLHVAQLDLNHCTIRSPIRGRVGKLDTYPGSLVSAAQVASLVTISQMDPLIVEFNVTEEQFAQIPHTISTIEITPLCTSNQRREAILTFFDNQFDHKTGLLLLHAQIQNPDYLLKPGQRVCVHIPIGTMVQAILIPQESIRHNKDEDYVYLLQNDMSVIKRQVVLGDVDGVDQIVLKGLDLSDCVIFNEESDISEGVSVRA